MSWSCNRATELSLPAPRSVMAVSSRAGYTRAERTRRWAVLPGSRPTLPKIWVACASTVRSADDHHEHTLLYMLVIPSLVLAYAVFAL